MELKNKDLSLSTAKDIKRMIKNINFNFIKVIIKLQTVI